VPIDRFEGSLACNLQLQKKILRLLKGYQSGIFSSYLTSLVALACLDKTPEHFSE
jgi:hypothetical protein